MPHKQKGVRHELASNIYFRVSIHNLNSTVSSLSSPFSNYGWIILVTIRMNTTAVFRRVFGEEMPCILLGAQDERYRHQKTEADLEWPFSNNRKHSLSSLFLIVGFK